MPLPDHTNNPRLARDALVLGPSAALNRDPTTTPSVNNTFQTVPQLRIPQQSATSQPPRLVSRSGQLQLHTKYTTTDVVFNQPIACPSDQQAGDVTRRPTIASKISSQGLSQQLSNVQIRRALKRNALINEGNVQ